MTKMGTMSRVWVLSVVSFGFAGCAANATDLAVEEALAEADIGAARQNVSCAPFYTKDEPANQIQNSNSCGTVVTPVRDSINRILITAVTTHVCNPLSLEEKMSMCSEGDIEEGNCHLSRVVRIRTELYGPNCTPSSDSDGGDEPSYDPEGDNHGDDYNRTDGCGFDQYGRWVCR